MGNVFEEFAKIDHPNKIMTSAEDLLDCPYRFISKKDLAKYVKSTTTYRRLGIIR